MNKNLLNYLLPIMALLFLASCQRAEEVKSKLYAFEIRTGGLGSKFEAFLNNTHDMATYNRERYKIENDFLDENTLYILKHHYQDTIQVVDTLKVRLQDNAVDSLYSLAHAYLANVDMDNEIEDGNQQIKEHVIDGASITVSLTYDNKHLEASQWGLKGAWRASEQAAHLLRFINKKIPEEFKLY